MATFVNPIGKGLTPERVDMGVDYGGSGPLYALGSGTIVNTTNSGWPGGGFLALHLDTGQYVYYAEDIQALVTSGQKVKAGEHIANATGGSSGIEVGFAAPPGTGETMAASAGQQAHVGDPGNVSTAYGALMSNLIASLGGPAGKLQGAISGSVPASFGISAKGNVTGTQQTGTSLTSATGLPGFNFSWPGDILGFFKDAKVFIDALLWIVNPASWLRIGSFMLGGILLLFGLYVLMKVGSDEPLFKMPTVVPVPV